MKQLTQIEFFPRYWDGAQYRFKLAKDGGPNTTLIDPTTIVSMDDKPSTKIVSWGKIETNIEMYYVQTTIVRGHGDFQGYWVTKKTYENILEKFVEIV